MEPRYFVHDLNDQNVTELRAEVARLDAGGGRLIAVGDEQNGIIAYAIALDNDGDDFAKIIVDALNAVQS